MKKRTMTGILLACISLTACSTKSEEKKEVPVRVEAEMVKTSEEVPTREYVGIVEEESATSVSFVGSGTLARICVSEGQKVTKGQLIAELDKTQSQNLLSAAEAMMMQAVDAEARMKQLHDNNSLPDMKWVEVQSKVQQAKAQVDMARKSLADCSVYAPVSGVIGKDVASVGETVLPAMPIAKILDIKTVKIKVSVPEKEISLFSADTPTQIYVDALGGKLFSGGKIEKGVEGSGLTHTYDIRINVSNANGELLPGMVCKVKLDNLRTSEPQNHITVPITAVHKNARGEHFVWLVMGDKATRCVVEIGEATGNRIAVTKGLNVGDYFVTKGHQKLSEGAIVKW